MSSITPAAEPKGSAPNPRIRIARPAASGNAGVPQPCNARRPAAVDGCRSHAHHAADQPAADGWGSSQTISLHVEHHHAADQPAADGWGRHAGGGIGRGDAPGDAAEGAEAADEPAGGAVGIRRRDPGPKRRETDISGGKLGLGLLSGDWGIRVAIPCRLGGRVRAYCKMRRKQGSEPCRRHALPRSPVHFAGTDAERAMPPSSSG